MIVCQRAFAFAEALYHGNAKKYLHEFDIITTKTYNTIEEFISAFLLLNRRKADILIGR